MKRQVVPREDGRVTLYYTFEDEEPAPFEKETPKRASTGQPSATESDIVLEEPK